ncbi:MAG: GNAT family N-acetyltransferase [Bacteroidales bacterium]|nr:GNAT family N-acetyltransferase [Bacteroidales bacterium]MCF8396701.1 GNAT family N-acetyltransferase [Bacteroidales bacterium]
MIKHLSYNRIDKRKWDLCISKSFNGNIYGYSWFLDIVAENWEALVQDDYDRVFPLTWKKSFGVHHLYQPFFTQQLGIYSKNILTHEVVSAFLEKIPERFRYTEIFLNAYNKPDEKKYKVEQQVNHELDLIKPYQNLAKSYSKNMRRNIRKAEKAGLSIVKNIKIEKVVDLFRANRGRQIRHLHENDYRRLRRLLYSCVYKNMAEVVGVYSGENNLLAGAVFIKSNRRAIFIFSGLSEEGKKQAAMPFLIDSFIKGHANAHLTLDFDGSNDPNLSRFYKSFGAKQTNYPKLTIDRLPWAVRMLFRLKRKLIG